MNRQTFCIVYRLLLLVGMLVISGCGNDSKNNPAEEPEPPIAGTALEKEAKYIAEISKVIDPLFSQCQTMGELSKHMKQIGNIEVVSEVWATDVALYIKTEGGSTLSWLYTPNVNVDAIRPAIRTDLSRQGKADTKSNVAEQHQYNRPERVGIINQVASDLKHAYTLPLCNEMEELFKKSGFQNTDFINGQEADMEFFLNRFTSYDIIFLLTHGSYDGQQQKHWLLTGEKINKSDLDDIKNALSIYGNYKIGLSTIQEVHDGKDTVNVSYLTFSEDCIPHMQGNFNKSVIFNIACQSLKNSKSLADAFKGKQARAYLGYDESNCVGAIAGAVFWTWMLQGMTIEAAYGKLSSEYPIGVREEHPDKHPAATLCFGIPESENICIIHPTVTTLDAGEMTGTTAIVHGQVDGWKATLDRDEAEAGFCWSKENSNPTIEGGNFKSQKISAYEFVGEETVSINGKMTSLTPNTTYYYRSFLYMNEEYYYGEVKEFKTVEEKQGMCPDGNHPHMIDLGLPSGTKWACCNVGASAPEEYGGLYGWGDPTGEYTENPNNYDYKSDEWYAVWEYYGGYEAPLDICNTKLDIASVKWGNNWRLPTTDEIKELENECISKSFEYKSIIGCLIEGPNNNKIFLPASGYRENTDIYARGEEGRYWSGMTEGILHFNSWGIINFNGAFVRYWGYSVRPVRK